MAELADARDSKSRGLRPVRVRPPLPAPTHRLAATQRAGHREILEGQADRFEERDVVGPRAHPGAAHDLLQVGDARGSGPIAPSPIGISRSPASSSAAARVSTTTRARRTVSVSTSRVCGWKAPTAFTCAPAASASPSNSGSVGGRAGAHDVGARRPRPGRPPRRRCPSPRARATSSLGPGRRPVTTASCVIGPHRHHRLEVGARLHPRPEDHEPRRVGAGEVPRGEPAHRGGAQRRERGPVDEQRRRLGDRIEERVDRVDQRQARRRVRARSG